MKKLLLSLAAVACFSIASAEVTLSTLDATNFQGTDVAEKPAEGTSYGEAHKVQPLEALTIGDYSFSFTKGTSKTDPAFYWSMSTAKDDVRTIRLYSGNTMTMKAPAGTTMIQVEFTGTNGKATANPTVTTGKMTVDGTTKMTWTGEANEFTITYDQTFRITSMTVYVSGDTPEEPEEPEPVVTEKVSTIAEFIAKCTEKDYPIVTLDEAVTVTYQNGRYLYIKDATGAMSVYGDLTTKYTNGDVIPAGITGGAQLYSNGVYQMTAPQVATFKAAEGTADASPVELSVGAVDAKLVSTYILLRDVTITAKEGAANNYIVSDEEGDEATLFNQFTNASYYDVVTVEEGENLDLYAIVTVYKGNVQLYPVKVVDPAGVASAIASETAPVEYFNLQGVRVANPENGLYIRRQGNTAVKVLVK